MSYQIRKTPKNKYQLREKPDGKGSRARLAAKPKAGPTAFLAPPEPPVLGEFDTTEAAAHFALQHEQGTFNWQTFDPQAELDRLRAQQEQILRS